MCSITGKILVPLLLAASSSLLFSQTAVIVDFPPGTATYIETMLALEGDVGYLPTQGSVTKVFSFSLSTGQLLDPDGLELGGPAGQIGLFDQKVVVPVGLPTLELAVIDISDPADLVEIGRIPMPFNVQGQRVMCDRAAGIGFIGSFIDDKIYSFSVDTLDLVDPDGVSVPFNVDATAYGGRYIAISGIHGNVMTVDALDPADMQYVGSIAFPGATFLSNDNPVFAADGTTGFISSNEAVLYSFDAATATRLDPDGATINTTGDAGYVGIHGDVVAAIHGRGVEFFDVSDPTDLRSISNCTPGGGHGVDFNCFGTQSAFGVIYPADVIYVCNVADASIVGAAFPVPGHPNFLEVVGGDRIVTLTRNPVPNVVIISGMFTDAFLGDLDGDGDVDLSDLAQLLSNYGMTSGATYEDGDLDGDGDVDLSDLAALLSAYGTTCP